ncbi:MAG: lipoyl synthase [Erythrobacter sp.]
MLHGVAGRDAHTDPARLAQGGCLPSGNAVQQLKSRLRENALVTVCEEASCPNIHECFSHGTATFMILGEVCTRRCSFCDVAHGRPNPLDAEEPRHLASAIAEMRLRYVVITSVDRDDLRDGGAAHFADCIRETRALNPGIRVEVLVPDFRGRMEVALDILAAEPPDVFNHNMETVPRLYLQARPGSDFEWSLDLLQRYKARCPDVLTKSGLMLGLGESNEEIVEVMHRLREHAVDMLTLGQYLQPTANHLPVARFVTPEEFDRYREWALARGFRECVSGPLVRSSYRAEQALAGNNAGLDNAALAVSVPPRP